MSNFLNLYTASKRLADTIKSGKQPEDYMIKNLVDAVDLCKFDETVIETKEPE